MKFDILNRWSGEVQFSAEVECTDDQPLSVKIGLAVGWALKKKANLRGADLHGADLRGADLRGADLRGADLSWADLSWADLRGADLRGADLSWADLRGANLYEADLSGAGLSWADLREADLSGADLSWANLRGANLYEADLRDGLKLIRLPMYISPIGRDSDTLAVWLTDKGIRLQRGCFFGTVEEFKTASDETHGKGTPVWNTYRAAITLIEAWAEEQEVVL